MTGKERRERGMRFLADEADRPNYARGREIEPEIAAEIDAMLRDRSNGEGDTYA